MAVIRGELFFAPGIRMRDLDLNDSAALLDAIDRRVDGLFLSPIRVLEMAGETEEGSLFASALLVAALIESLARLETGSDAQGTLIREWLEAHVPSFSERVSVNGQVMTLANVFEYRFRNGLAHNGYIASLGRLSREIDAPVVASGEIVTVNPFVLAKIVADRWGSFARDLRTGARDIRRFRYHVVQQFQTEVTRAQQEG